MSVARSHITGKVSARLTQLVALAALALALALACAITYFQPATAFAAEANYTIDEISTDLQVAPDGTAHIVSRQVLTFDGPNKGYVWYLLAPEEGESVKINSVRAVEVDDGGSPAGNWIKLQMFDVHRSAQGASPGDIASPSLRTEKTQPWYSYSISDGMVRSWFPAENGTYLIEADYTVRDYALVYHDVSELYWRYAHGSLPVDSNDITLKVTLPVPEGATAQPGDVLAWGHGPNEGRFDVAEDGTVVYHLDHLKSGQYAEAHIIFPTSWLTELNANSTRVYAEMHKQAAIQEEGEWVDAFARGERWDYLVRMLFLGLAAVVILVGAVCVARFGRTYRSRRALIRTGCTLGIMALGVHLFFREPFTVVFLALLALAVLIVALFLPREGEEEPEEAAEEEMLATEEELAEEEEFEEGEPTTEEEPSVEGELEEEPAAGEESEVVP